MQFLQLMVDNMPIKNPFFSALQDPNVRYLPTSQHWMSRLFLHLYQTSHLSYPLIILGNIAALNWLPTLAAVPLATGMLFLGAQYRAYYQAQYRKEQFMQNVGNIAPPRLMHPMLKDRKHCTFNHVFSFVKSKGHIWYALREKRDKPPVWKLFYIDNLQLTSDQFNAAEMLVDGENFMLRVPGILNDTIYYKKVVEEQRVGNQFIVSNLSEEPEAIGSWFTLPILNLLKPSQLGKRLTVNKNAKWAMSNAAEYKQKVIDDRGIIHGNIPITSVYEYLGKRMALHDPFVETGSTFTLTLPSQFQIVDQFEASASVIFSCSHSCGNTVKRPQLTSMYLDYDSEGINPLISFTFDVNNTTKRLLPINKSKNHRLPIGLKEISNLTVLQCSHDPHSIEIRVQSKSKDNGFYYKKMDDENWQYYDSKTGKVNADIQSHKALKPITTIQYEANKPFLFKNKIITKVSAADFDPNRTFCPLIFEIDGKKIYSILRRHKNLVKSFFGFASESWSLNPDPGHVNDSLLVGDDSIAVQMTVSGNQLQLGSKDGRFSFLIDMQKRCAADNENGHPLPFYRLTRSKAKQSAAHEAKLLSSKLNLGSLSMRVHPQ